ncbi:hypothetical protein SAY87_018469 [Trapa incisa]|uniref:Uncharacterized protein n=2 Tax=Trapa TaxID=22665 RepID=A0AAN7QZB5_TRANT|nr:hypothetical protein SAY87_018469 [Trapa incisa]KAK4784562.1 hypothetical protein SAY86_018930 [Trapa natans]
MAPNRFVGICSLLLVMLLCHELMGGGIEARNLKSSKEKMIIGSRTVSSQVGSHGSPSFVMQKERVAKAEQLDDFRPTNPGHSPGVGHAINN